MLHSYSAGRSWNDLSSKKPAGPAVTLLTAIYVQCPATLTGIFRQQSDCPHPSQHVLGHPLIFYYSYRSMSTRPFRLLDLPSLVDFLAISRSNPHWTGPALLKAKDGQELKDKKKSISALDLMALSSTIQVCFLFKITRRKQKRIWLSKTGPATIFI